VITRKFDLNQNYIKPQLKEKFMKANNLGLNGIKRYAGNDDAISMFKAS
jgi:hypothetical protein